MLKLSGVKRNRTANPQLAKLVLYQLSYNPKTTKLEFGCYYNIGKPLTLWA
jgi:hypothetical protein